MRNLVGLMVFAAAVVPPMSALGQGDLVTAAPVAVFEAHVW